MADLPLEGRTEQKDEKKPVPLTLEQQVSLLRKDIIELSRGVNTQARLLEAIVAASEHIIKVYNDLIQIPEGVAGEPKKEDNK